MININDRFWSKVDKDIKKKECWIWIAGKDKDGYGNFTDKNNRMVKAHRFSYELMFGKIPKGLVSDHLCRNRSCVNPFHIEIVTIKENNRRSLCMSGVNARKTHCIRGHEFSKENINERIESSGITRRCKQCIKIRGKEYKLMLKKRREKIEN